MRRWALVLHGGQREIPPEERAAARAGCEAALAVGIAVLRRGGPALEAVESVLRVLEDDPVFNAGRGGARNADGEVELDAAVMDGATLDVGAVAAIRGVRHPVSVARRMLRAQPILLVAEGARRFAERQGAELAAPAPPSGKPRQDTVGCVALDTEGHVAAATSTGGLDGSHAGRVGDSPMPGCGFYAEDAVGAVAFSGTGEHIARAALAARAMAAIEAGTLPEAAMADAVRRVEALGGEVGGIALDHQGRIGWRHNGPNFAVGLAAEDEPPRVHLAKGEERETRDA
jgi:beta-aspartyl-peptidase (threonine type)